MTTVITFDVDGTLVISEGQNANRLHKLAFAHAWRTVFGFEGDIDEVPHHVRTPPAASDACRTMHGRTLTGAGPAGDDGPLPACAAVRDPRHPEGAGTPPPLPAASNWPFQADERPRAPGALLPIRQQR
jgi:hypothetical protein